MRKIYQARVDAAARDRERENERGAHEWPRGTLVAGELRVQIQVCLKNTL